MQLLPLAYALAAGLTICGLATSLIELATGKRAGLRPPFVARRRLLVSVGAAFAAGPYMLGNEALAARRQGLIGRLALIVWAVVAGLWALATGVVAVEVTLAVGRFLA